MSNAEYRRPSPEVPFWKGPNAELLDETLIKPHEFESVTVGLSQDSIPSNLLHDFDALASLKLSGRSRYAQIGIEVMEFAENLKEILISEPGRLVEHGSIPIQVGIINHSERPIRLAEGARLFRPYYDSRSPRVMNNELMRLIAEKKIEIEGEYGEDWAWLQEGGRKTGVVLKLDDEKRRWIPPSDLVLSISDSDGINFRSEIDNHLEDVPEEESIKLWIGETKARIQFKDGIHGILHPVATRTINGKGSKFDELGLQIASRVLDPVDPSDPDPKYFWRIRTEIKSPTSKEKRSNYVALHFVKP